MKENVQRYDPDPDGSMCVDDRGGYVQFCDFSYNEKELLARIAALKADVTELEVKLSKDNYKRGFLDGITAYAHWDDGTQLVGTIGTTLARAKKNVKGTWNYNPDD